MKYLDREQIQTPTEDLSDAAGPPVSDTHKLKHLIHNIITKLESLNLDIYYDMALSMFCSTDTQSSNSLPRNRFREHNG